MCWIAFNIVPHVLLLGWGKMGQGGFMIALCRVGIFITTVAGFLALVLMWLLWPREAAYGPPMRASLTFLEACSSSFPILRVLVLQSMMQCGGVAAVGCAHLHAVLL